MTKLYFKPLTDPLIEAEINRFRQYGGVIQFQLFQNHLKSTNTDTHYQIAQQTLTETELANNRKIKRAIRKYKINSGKFIDQKKHFSKLENTGYLISPALFFGPEYNPQTKSLFVKGVKTLNTYFAFDSEEVPENSVDIDDYIDEDQYLHSDGITRGFCKAFLEPPYSLRFGNTILEKGTFFLEFCNLLFSEHAEIEVYKWSVDSSNYFDDGKVWWGAHFWTVYNPKKNIYIGIMASASD